MTEEQNAALNNALYGTNIQMALPQVIQPITKKQYQTQAVMYDPEKLEALKMALIAKRGDLQPLKTAITAPRPVMSKWEAVANALAQTPEPKSFTGGFGEEIINPWAEGISNFARSFGTAYAAKKAADREAAAQAREDAIKAAELDYNIAEKEREDAIKAAQADYEASKYQETSQVSDDYIKYNDPNAKTAQAMLEQQRSLNTINTMRQDLEDIGRRFDEDFKDIDEMQKESTRLGRNLTNGLFGVGATKGEKLARDQFEAWKGSMKNVLVNANRQAGSGSMSDADAARYEQNIGQTTTPAEARNILDAFEKRMKAGLPGTEQVYLEKVAF